MRLRRRHVVPRLRGRALRRRPVVRGLQRGAARLQLVLPRLQRGQVRPVLPRRRPVHAGRGRPLRPVRPDFPRRRPHELPGRRLLLRRRGPAHRLRGGLLLPRRRQPADCLPRRRLLPGGRDRADPLQGLSGGALPRPVRQVEAVPQRAVLEVPAVLERACPGRVRRGLARDVRAGRGLGGAGGGLPPLTTGMCSRGRCWAAGRPSLHRLVSFLKHCPHKNKHQGEGRVDLNDGMNRSARVPADMIQY